MYIASCNLELPTVVIASCYIERSTVDTTTFKIERYALVIDSRN